MKKLFLVMVCIVLFLFALNAINQRSSHDSLKVNDLPSIQSLNSNNSIFNITNNSGLALYAITGNGSAINPYIIGNFLLNNCSSNEIGIDIQNTNQYFSLSNVTVIGCSLGISFTNVTHGSIVNSKVQLGSSIGIFFNLTTNSNLLNISVTSSTNGFNITNSRYITLENNSASSISGNNFVFSNSSNSALFNNVVTDGSSSNKGFQLDSFSNYNNLTKNTVNNAKDSAFDINSSENNYLANNIVLQSQLYVFNLQSASNNYFLNNSVNNSFIGFYALNSAVNNTFIKNLITYSATGILLRGSTNVLLAENVINHLSSSNTDITGIFLDNSSNCIIENNIVIHTYFGFNLSNSYYNNISLNLAQLVVGYGFYLYSSSFNYLLNNSVLNPESVIIAGFNIDNSNNNTLERNFVNVAGGLEYNINNSSLNFLYGNTGVNSQNSCYQLVNASHNNLVNNTAINCNSGIILINSNYNNFNKNSVIYGSYGFKLTSSSYNTFTGNYGANNSAADYQDLSNLTNTLIENNFTSISDMDNNLVSDQTTTVPRFNFFWIKDFSLEIPEITILSLIFLIPVASIYPYKKITGGKKKFNTLDLNSNSSFNNKSYLRLLLIGPILTFFATIYYSTKHRNLDYFDLKSNELRGKILIILDDQHFIHFNKLKEILNCGVSILKWHIQVLHEFNIVNWETIGQYKVIYLVEKPPAIKEVNLFYSMTNDKVVFILEEFLRTSTWQVDTLANKSLLRKDSVLHHCKKLASINILKENPETHEFSMPMDTKEMVKKILFKKVYYNSKKIE